ncbi:MAG: PAS domain S-box protein, partial [Candidatus Tectomicrobia bacterium]|nr:PAS domain S-box protein [Candidatus Tectomicrobia bacterium]
NIPVVGIGASAGGLEAARQFFTTMPPTSGVAFVLIQHLAPDHDSLMAELLGRYTTMPVVEIENHMHVEANHVYLIPPNKYASISQGELYLTPLVEQRGMRMPIDFFFYSLAEDQYAQAVGIVLSGTGTDGTLGLQAIKNAGGMVMAQDPATAQHDGMLRSVITAGVVDYVLSVDQMPEPLLKYLQHPYVNGNPQVADQAPLDYLHRILAVMQARTGYDFSVYKHNTLRRRIDRRMGVRHAAQVADYIRYLRTEPEEVSALFQDLLISVTSFFREPEAWEYLGTEVLPRLVAETPVGGAIRVWSPGCASGEEPYTLAMLLLKQLQAMQKSPRVQIFATDIDEYALGRARAGLYPESIAADVPLPYLEQFFTLKSHAYQVNKELREAVTFSVQNLISDPPFSNLDLISCRNLLIYFQPEVQQKVLGLFHFALRPQGRLILGKSESIGNRQDLFEVESKELRIYQRLETAQSRLIHFPISGVERGASRVAQHPVPGPESGRSLNLTTVTQQQLLRELATTTVLINRNYDVLNMQGPVRQYLDFPEGEPTYNLTKIAMHGLRTKLRVALTQAVRKEGPVTVTNARVKRDGTYYPVTCYIRPVTEPSEAQGLFLVTFQDEPQPALPIAEVQVSELDESTTVQQLELELEMVREDLKNSLEEMETSNEEMKTSNEEIMSINEELQSANEELETSKEELQSLNEELATLNVQLQEKMQEVERTNDDLTNLEASTNIATLFLDLTFCIKRFTPAMQQLLHLIPADVGRPIEDISQKFIHDSDGPVSLRDDAETVLDTLIPLERERQMPDGRWHIQRMLPYRTEHHRIEGVVVTFTDVTRIKEVHEVMRESEHLRLITDHLPALIAHVGPDERYRYANQTYAQSFGRRADEICGLHVREVVGDDVYQRHKPYQDAVLNNEVMIVEDRLLTAQGKLEWGLMHLVPHQTPDGQGDGYFVLVTDISARKRAEEALLASEERLLAIFHNAAHGLALTDRDGRFLQVNNTLSAMLGYTQAELCQMTIRDVTHPDDLWPTIENIEQLFSGQSDVFTLDKRYQRKDSTVFWVELSVTPVRHPGGGIESLVAIITDITQRKETETALQSALAAIEAHRGDGASPSPEP